MKTIGHTNEIPSVTQRSSAWLRVAEYGDWPHAQGLQRFTPESADVIVKHFKSLRGRLARKFGGLPIYIGHPDDDYFVGQSGHTDTRAYAWITALDARPDGLYILPRWSDAGQTLLRNAFYKFLSPRWAMRPLSEGVYEPVRLISVGLTNHPNMPGDVIANEAAAPSTRKSKEEAKATDRVVSILDEALANGVIAPNERAHWVTGLMADFDLGLSELKARRPALKTIACTDGLRQRVSSTQDFLTLVNERASRTGESFDHAWQTLKQERPELYADQHTF